MTIRNPFGSSDKECPLERPGHIETTPRVIRENSDFRYQVIHLVQNIYEKLSDPQQGATLVGYSEDMTVREVLDFLLINSGTGPVNFLELLEGKVDKVIGKSLSDENFTLEEKNKLSNLEILEWSTKSW